MYKARKAVMSKQSAVQEYLSKNHSMNEDASCDNDFLDVKSYKL